MKEETTPMQKRPIDRLVSLMHTLVQHMLWVPVQVWEIKAVGCALALQFLWPWLEWNDRVCVCETGHLKLG